MLTLERQEEILNILRQKKSVTVAELSKTLFASGSTIRRDLAQLENEGLIRRSHGGAVLFESSGDEASARVREQQNRREKKLIGELGAGLVAASSSLFIDSSSTVGAMIPALKGLAGLTVITNGLRNALLLAEDPDIRVVIACGTVRPNTGSLYGADTLSFLSRLHPDYCFISCGGITESGIRESTLEQGAIKRQMLSQSAKRVLLCDQSKFGVNCLYEICGLNGIDLLVTDALPPENLQAALRQNGVKILLPQVSKKQA